MKNLLVGFTILCLTGCTILQPVEPQTPPKNEQSVNDPIIIDVIIPRPPRAPVTPDVPDVPTQDPVAPLPQDPDDTDEDGLPPRGDVVEQQLFTSGFAMCQVQPDLTICRNECDRVNNQRYFCTEGYEFIFERDGDKPQ